MASYFQDPSQSFVPTPIYHPPFEALQSTLMGNQQKYDAGLSGVRAAYNSVFNAPLTKGENSQVRAQYLQEASKKLENLSQIDLGNESNAMEARSVYSNFLNDNDVINDMVYTKGQNNEVNKSQSFKADKDSNQYVDGRNTANMISGMDQVRSAKRGDLSVYNVRKFIPYNDFAKDIAKQATETKFAVESVDDKGIVTVKKTNGASSLGNWTTFVDGMMGDRYGDQFRDEALYTKEQGIKRAQYKYALNNEGAQQNKQDAFKDFVIDNFNTYYKNNNNTIKNYDDALANVGLEFEKYKKTGLTNDDVHYAEKLQAYKDHITGMEAQRLNYSKTAETFNPTSKQYAENLKAFVDNPDGNLYAQIRTAHVNNVATALASNEKIDSPVANPMYTEAHKAQMDAADNMRKNMQSADDHQAALDNHDEHLHPDIYGSGKSGKTDVSSTGSAKEQVTAERDQLKFVGQANNQISSMTPAKRFDMEQNRLLEAGYNSLLSAEGIGGIISNVSGNNIPYEDVVTYMSAINSDRKASSYSPEEKAISEKINNLFTNNGIKLDGTDRLAIGRGIQMLTGKYLKENTGTDKWSKEHLSNIAADNKLATQAIGEYNRNNKLHDDAILKYTLDPKNKDIVIDRNGKKDFINANDIANMVGDVNATEDNQVFFGNPIVPFGVDRSLSGIGYNTTAHLKKEDIAKAFMEGKVKIEDRGTKNELGESKKLKLTIGDKVYSVNGSMDVTDAYGHTTKEMRNDVGYNQIMNLKNKFPDSADVPQRLSKISNTALGDLPMSKETGRMGNTFNLDFDPKKGGSEKAIRVINQVSQPGAHDIPIVNGVEDDSKELGNVIQKISNWGSSDIYKYTNPPQYLTQGPDGRPSIKLSLNPESKSDIASLGLDPTTLDKLYNGVYLPIKNNNAPDLQKLLHPGLGIYVYSQMSHGKKIVADDIEKGLDINYKVIPNNTNNPTGVRVFVTRKEMQPDRTMKTIESTPTDFLLSEHNPDEIMGYIKSLIDQHVERNTSMKALLDEQDKTKEKSDIRKINEKTLADFEAKEKQ